MLRNRPGIAFDLGEFEDRAREASRRNPCLPARHGRDLCRELRPDSLEGYDFEFTDQGKQKGLDLPHWRVLSDDRNGAERHPQKMAVTADEEASTPELAEPVWEQAAFAF